MLYLTEALRRLSSFALLSILTLVSSTGLRAQQSVDVRATEIGGVVASSKGPETGVWVIAETTDLPTKMNKTVVTDDQGRYVIPDLPKANYIVWARGYGLVDSAKTTSEPGKMVNITAVPAPPSKAPMVAPVSGAATARPARKPTAVQPRMLATPGNGSRSKVNDPSGCRTTTTIS